MMMRKFLSGFGDSSMSSSGLPSTSNRSANAPSSITPSLPGIRIARTGHGEQFGVGGGRHRQDFGVRVPAGQMGQHRALARRHAAENSRSEPNAVLILCFRQRVGAVRAGEDLKRLDPAWPVSRPVSSSLRKG